MNKFKINEKDIPLEFRQFNIPMEILENPVDGLEDLGLSKIRYQVVEKIVQLMEENNLKWRKGWDFPAPYNFVTGKSYKGINLINLLFSSFGDPRWMTFNQANKKGFSIKKGSKGTAIEVWKRIYKKTKKEISFSEIDELTKNMTWKEKQEWYEENIIQFAKTFHVFNAEQIDGIPPYQHKATTKEQKEERNNLVEKIIFESPARIFYDGGGRAYYNPTSDTIHLPKIEIFNSNIDYYSTALHEMGHSTGHHSRLDRKFSGKFGSPEYAKEELVAEFCSVLTGSELDLAYSQFNIENHASYLKGWLTAIKKDPTVLITAIYNASRAADFLLKKYKKQMETRENPTNTKTKKTQANTKKMLVNKNSKLITNEEQKEKAMATKQKRKTTKRKLSPAQLAALEKGRKTRAKNLAAKKAAQKKKTSTRKNPVKKKTPAKKTAARKPATRRTPARKTPAKKPASRKPTTRKNPFVAGATYTDVPEPPKFNKSKAIYVGRLPHLEYITEAGTNSPRPFKYKHEFEGEIPYLVSDGNNLFIVKGNKKMHFDPKRGIVG